MPLPLYNKKNISQFRLDNFDDNVDIFCDMVSSKFGIEIHSKTFMLSILSLSQRGGEYHSDSDIDGILDVDESNLGYDPVNPRSQVNGVLDGICEMVGGISQCYNLMEGISCNTDIFMPSGFSDCDIKVLKKYWRDVNLDSSSDWDKDGVPNFVEIVKGTDPVIDDMSNDPDNDGLSTRFEIMRSMNPFEHKKISSLDFPQVILRNEPDLDNEYQCGKGERAMHLILESTPLVPSQALMSGMEDLRHGVNEHVVAVFSSKISQNYLLLDKGLMGRFIKLKVAQSEDGNEGQNREGQYILVPSISELTNVDLEEWGQ